MALLIGTAFAGYVLYSFLKKLGSSNDAVEFFSYLAGIYFVLWLVGLV